jgi:hypothetical protein
MLLSELAIIEGRGFLSRLRDETVERDLKKLTPLYGSREKVFAEARRRRRARETPLPIGVSYVTIVKACTHGKPIRDFTVAEKLSEATGRRVSVPDICDPAGAKKRARRRKAA